MSLTLRLKYPTCFYLGLQNLILSNFQELNDRISQFEYRSSFITKFEAHEVETKPISNEISAKSDATSFLPAKSDNSELQLKKSAKPQTSFDGKSAEQSILTFVEPQPIKPAKTSFDGKPVEKSVLTFVEPQELIMQKYMKLVSETSAVSSASKAPPQPLHAEVGAGLEDTRESAQKVEAEQ